ncbi:hypothetical protein [Streptomyces natalensis]|uniref:Uncharacterized protein n=1 Tax=Streptomyces natalensis ATCC 27448 TaxID=1240678 RepID=A0A0D7CDW0_9ACTN|nr:hypothetical protein [Streptomyces natalensis]KIZ13567.1 hypothetical protein SNA_36710 [Streptomyces natalensis ATCC 27448]
MTTPSSTPSTPPVPRLLPWTTPDGDKPCYLLTDAEGGYLSDRADRMEAVQLRMGKGLLEHAQEMVEDPATDARQLRFLSVQLGAALRDAVRIAESRGGGGTA